MENNIQPNIQLTPSRTKTNPLVIISLILLLILVASGAFVLGKYLAENKSEPAIPTPLPTADPTAGWKSYENKQYGFSFKYPSVLPYNVIDILDYKDKESFDVWIKNYETEIPKCNTMECPPKFTYSIKKSISVLDKKAYYYENSGMAGPKQILIIDLGSYKIGYITFLPNPIENPDNPVSEINRQYFDQILSTFKFID